MKYINNTEEKDRDGGYDQVQHFSDIDDPDYVSSVVSDSTYMVG